MSSEYELVVNLIRTFDAVVVPNALPLCGNPSHRGVDWFNDGGRTICGVCHPSARTTAQRRSDELTPGVRFSSGGGS